MNFFIMKRFFLSKNQLNILVLTSQISFYMYIYIYDHKL